LFITANGVDLCAVLTLLILSFYVYDQGVIRQRPAQHCG